jgi:hypothetical protein
VYRAGKRRLVPCARVCFADARLYEYGEGKKAVFLLPERVEWRLELLDFARLDLMVCTSRPRSKRGFPTTQRR